MILKEKNKNHVFSLHLLRGWGRFYSGLEERSGNTISFVENVMSSAYHGVADNL